MLFNQISGEQSKRNHSQTKPITHQSTDNQKKYISTKESKINTIDTKKLFEDQNSEIDDNHFSLPLIKSLPMNKLEKFKPKKVYNPSKKPLASDQQQIMSQQKFNILLSQSNHQSNLKNRFSFVNLWKTRLKHKEQNIILNYLNGYIDTKKQKYKKRKKKVFIARDNENSQNYFLLLSQSQTKYHKKNKSQFLNYQHSIRKQPKDLGQRKSLVLNLSNECLIAQNKQKYASISKNKHKQIPSLKKRVCQLQNKANKNNHNVMINFIQQSFKQTSNPNSKKTKKDSFQNFQYQIYSNQLNNKNDNSQKTLSSQKQNLSTRIFNKKNCEIKTSELNQQSQGCCSIYNQEQLQIQNAILFKDQEIQTENNLNIYSLDRYKKQNRKQLFKNDQKNKLPAQEVSETEKKNQKKQIKTNSLNITKKMSSLSELSANRNLKSVFQPSKLPDKSFLNLKTYYSVLMESKSSSTQKHLKNIQLKTKKFQKQQIPSQSQLHQFISSYVAQNSKIDIQNLIISQNFKILLEQQRQLYFGEIVNGKKQGRGITIRQNYLYEGFYKNGEKIFGMEINQAGKYYGQFENQKKQGTGEFSWNNHQFYTGQWLEGKKHGKGIWSSSNGDSYTGQWMKGQVQGEGIHISSNGQKYQGSFHKFLKSGAGEEILPNGDRYNGQFLKGMPQGKGQYLWKSGQAYEGCFSKGFRTGYGVFKDSAGNIYKGTFHDQIASGQCEIIFSNQDYYNGQIQNAKFNGNGRLQLYQSEEVLEGIWHEDQFLGIIS